AAIFDEKKLNWMNGLYIREMPLNELTTKLTAFYDREIPESIVAICQEKLHTLADFWPMAAFFFDGPVTDEKASTKFLDEEGKIRLAEARRALEQLETFDAASIEATLRGVCEALELKPNKVFQPIRVAISGTTISPGIFESLELLGRQDSLQRIEQALNKP
ncbi:MAG: hypothetical protein JHD02_10390, partial [Thermoleophilaceae bacterium]|nr:hypothetical protein [Thermoleophilaceae bacterium]